MVSAFKLGLMVPLLSANGNIIKLMDLEFSIIPIQILIEEAFSMIEHLDSVSTIILMELFMKDIGLMIIKMVMESRNGTIIRFLKENTLKEKNKELVIITGVMARLMKVIGLKIA